MTHKTLTLLLTALLAVASGCSQKMMQTPAIIALGGLVDPFKNVDPEYQSNLVDVFVAAPRHPSGNDKPALFYKNDRADEIRLGKATVQFGGDDMTWDELVELSLAEKRKRDVGVKLLDYQEYGVLWASVEPKPRGFDRDFTAPDADRGPADAFLAEVNRRLDASRRGQIMIFVHGFNTKFHSNLGIAAEFSHYLSRDGVMMSFAWPSKGSVFAYQEDKANADYATRQFRQLLMFLAEHTTAREINIIGHSAGSPIILETLADLSLMNWERDAEEIQARTKLGRVVLAAPDMDLKLAQHIGLDGAARVAKTVVLYLSKHDKALGASGGIFGAVRLGAAVTYLDEESRQFLNTNPQVELIDVTEAANLFSSFLGHSYFHQNPWVSTDVALMLALGASPEDRGLVLSDTRFWTFPEDYGDRMREVSQKLREKYLKQD